MPTPSKTLDAAIKRAEASRHDPARFARIKAYVAAARKRGIEKPKDYDIPLIDTIGKAAHKSSRSQAR